MIIPCSCDHEAQDRIHGNKKRVHNECNDGQMRCTVCKSEKTPKVNPNFVVVPKS